MTPTTMPSLEELDVSNLELWQHGPPHEVFRELREMPGLHWSELGDFPTEGGFWSVVRFEDIAAVGRDHETFSSDRSIILVDKLAPEGEPDPIDISANMLISQDPPRHDRLKSLVQRAFTPKRAIEHTERMREIINLIWDRALEAHPDGRIDLVQDVGIYVPSMVIGDMLGLPPEDGERLKGWSDALATCLGDARIEPQVVAAVAAGAPERLVVDKGPVTQAQTPLELLLFVHRADLPLRPLPSKQKDHS